MRRVDDLVGTERVDELLRLVPRREVAVRVGPPTEHRAVLRHVDSRVPVLHALRRGAGARRPLRDGVELVRDRALRSDDHEGERDGHRHAGATPEGQTAPALQLRDQQHSGQHQRTDRSAQAAEAARLDEADESAEEHGTGDRPHDQRPFADHDDDSDGQEACDEAREVVRVAERRPHGAGRTEGRTGVHEVDPVPVRAQLEVGGLDEAIKNDQPARGEHESRQDAPEVAHSPRLGSDERDDGEREEGEQAVVGLVGTDQAQAGADAEDRRERADSDHREDWPVQPSAQVGPLGVRDRVDDPEHREGECADHEHGELRQAESLCGARVEGHGERDDDPQHADPPGATERVGGVPQVTTRIDDGDRRPRQPDHEKREPERREHADGPQQQPQDRQARADDQREADPRLRCRLRGRLGSGLASRGDLGARRGLRVDDDRPLGGRGRRRSGRLGRARGARRAVRRAPRFGHRVSIGARPQPVGSAPSSSAGTSESSTPDSTARITTAAVSTYADVRSMRLTTNATMPRQIPIV